MTTIENTSLAHTTLVVKHRKILGLAQLCTKYDDHAKTCKKEHFCDIYVFHAIFDKNP